MQLKFANGTQRTTDWQSVNWRKAHRVVKNLRQRIFRATRQRNWKRVRNLQRLLLKSYSNVLLAVRRVTQINAGKHTPGIDKMLVKTSAAKALLVERLKQSLPWTPLATRRVYIPKRNGKRRPLGIPTIVDRCLQDAESAERGKEGRGGGEIGRIQSSKFKMVEPLLLHLTDAFRISNFVACFRFAVFLILNFVFPLSFLCLSSVFPLRSLRLCGAI